MDATLDPKFEPQSGNNPKTKLFDTAEQYEKERAFERAIESYHQLLGYDLSEVERFDVYKNLGNVYLKTSELNLAEGCYCKAAVIFPKSSILKVNMGVLEIQKGNLEKAKAFFVEAIDLDATNDTGWMGMALVHRAYSDFELSKACTLKALDLNPANKSALTHLIKWSREDLIEIPREPLVAFLKIFPDDREVLSIFEESGEGN